MYLHWTYGSNKIFTKEAKITFNYKSSKVLIMRILSVENSCIVVIALAVTAHGSSCWHGGGAAYII